MKFLCWLSAVATVFILMSPANADCGKTLRWVAPVFPPYSYQSEDGQANGWDIELGSAILKRAGCKFEIQFKPWKRCLREIQTGASDFLVAASQTPEREVYARFSVPYRTERYVAWYRKGDQRVERLTSYKQFIDHNLTLAYTSAIWLGKEFEDLKKDPHFSTRMTTVYDASNLTHNILTLLTRKRFDIAVADSVSGYDWAKRLDIADQVVVHPVPVNEGNVHFMMNRDSVSEEIIQRLNNAIKDFKNSPDYERINAIYQPRAN